MRLPAMAARESHTISQASVSEESISVLLAGSVVGMKAAIGDRVCDAVCCRSQRARTSRSDLVERHLRVKRYVRAADEAPCYGSVADEERMPRICAHSGSVLR